MRADERIVPINPENEMSYDFDAMLAELRQYEGGRRAIQVYSMLGYRPKPLRERFPELFVKTRSPKQAARHAATNKAINNIAFKLLGGKWNY